MNRTLLLPLCLILLLFSHAALATEDPAIDFQLSNGMKVILLPSTENDVVALHMVFPNTSQRQTKENAGIENLLFGTMVRGSQNYPKAVLDRELDRIGAHIGGSAGRDYSSFKLLCLRPFFDSTLAMFVDAIQHPLLEQPEIEIVRQKMLSAVRAKQDNPDEILALALNEHFFANHPYRIDTDGTLESLAVITREDLISHHGLILNQLDSFIVAVGNLDPDQLRVRLEHSLGKLQRDAAAAPPLPGLTPDTELVMKDKQLPTRYILGKFAAPSLDGADYAALKIGLRILSYRLWETVRTKRGLAYAVFSGLARYQSNYGFVYITTNQDSEAIPLVHQEMQRLATEPVPADELTSAKAVYHTEYYMSQEDNSSQAGLLAVGEIYLGDYRLRYTPLNKISDVTSSDIMTTAKKYLEAIHYGILGNTENLDISLYAFPPADETKEKPQSAPETIKGGR